MKINQGQFSPLILIEPSTARVKLWSTDLQDDSDVDPDWLTIQGEAAHWLFCALTGHWMHEPGCEARPFKARAARAHIDARWRFLYPALWGYVDTDEEEYWLRAKWVVQQWGGHIWPGLCPDIPLFIDLDSGAQLDDAGRMVIPERRANDELN